MQVFHMLSQFIYATKQKTVLVISINLIMNY